MKRRLRTVALLVALIGMFGATAVMQTTSASWNDSANFEAEVSSGNWGPPPPPPPPTSEGGISPGNSDTVINDIVWSISGARQFCTEVLITGASATTAQHWAINIDLRQAPFYGVAADQVSVNGTGTITVVNAQNVRITGRTHGGGWDPRTNNTPITSVQTARLTICVYNAPVPPPADPSWYTVSRTQGTWTATQACIVTTITIKPNAFPANPFFYGWTTQLNLADAKARITSSGNVLNFVSWTPYPNGETDMFATPPSYQPPLDTYTVRSGFNMALRAGGGGANSRTFTACVNGYSTNGNGKGNGNGNVQNAAPTMATPSIETTSEATEETEKTGTTVPAARPPSTTPATAPATPGTPTTSAPPATTIPESGVPTPTTVDPITSPTTSPAATVPTATIPAGETTPPAPSLPSATESP